MIPARESRTVDEDGCIQVQPRSRGRRPVSRPARQLAGSLVLIYSGASDSGGIDIKWGIPDVFSDINRGLAIANSEPRMSTVHYGPRNATAPMSINQCLFVHYAKLKRRPARTGVEWVWYKLRSCFRGRTSKASGDAQSRSVLPQHNHFQSFPRCLKWVRHLAVTRTNSQSTLTCCTCRWRIP